MTCRVKINGRENHFLVNLSLTEWKRGTEGKMRNAQVIYQNLRNVLKTFLLSLRLHVLSEVLCRCQQEKKQVSQWGSHFTLHFMLSDFIVYNT